MIWLYLITMVIQLCLITPGFSELTATISWVGDGPDYFQGYGARVFGSYGDLTSYAINCLATETDCQTFSPDLTVIAGPSTYDLMGTGVAFDIKSECTFIGDPTPTLATCVQTLSYHNTPLVTTSSITVTGTDNPSTGIYPAFLRMTKTGKPTITDELTTADQYAETKGPLTTEESTVSETSNLGPTSPKKFTMTETSTAIWTGTTIPIATGVQIPPRPGNSTSYLKGTKTVTLIVTETPPTITCKCNCEYPTHSQYDGRVVSSTTPNKGNTIIGKQIAVSLVGAIFAIILFCM